MNNDALVIATYFLVGGNALLVIASVAPVVQRWLDSKMHRASDAAQIVPDMNIFRSRLEGMVNKLVGQSGFDLDRLDKLMTEMEIDAKQVHKLPEKAYQIALKFVNDLYVARHFVSCAMDDTKILIVAAEKATGSKSVHDHLSTDPAPHHTQGILSSETRIRKVAESYQAALLSLKAAEQQLPRSVRTVEGKSFWDRYSSTISARQNEAGKALVDVEARRKR